jgi:hypothetical protein
MAYRICLVLSCVLVFAWAHPLVANPQAQAQTAIPDTPAGRTFKAWLEAFNSGDHAQLDAYYKKFQPDDSADSIMPFRNATGGFDLLAIEKSEPLRIEFLVKERNGGPRAIGALALKDANSTQVANFTLRALPPGVSTSNANFKIDAATRARVIDGAIAQLQECSPIPRRKWNKPCAPANNVANTIPLPTATSLPPRSPTTFAKSATTCTCTSTSVRSHCRRPRKVRTIPRPRRNTANRWST